MHKKKSKEKEEHHHWQHFDGMSKHHGKDYAPAKIEASKLPTFKQNRKHNVNVTIEKLN
jgi:hypothetical protein